MIIIMAVVWLIVIVGGAALVAWAISRTGTTRVATTGGQPLDILRERYARGEINKDEYDRMRQDLS